MRAKQSQILIYLNLNLQFTFKNLNLPLNKILNSLILKILLSKNASISTLEVHILDNFFILAYLKKFCDKK